MSKITTKSKKYCWVARQDKCTPYFKLALEVGGQTFYVGGLRATMKSIKNLLNGNIVFVHNDVSISDDLR